MNWAHVHLIINHFPIMAMPVVFAFMAYAAWKKDEGARRFSLGALVVVALVSIPVFLTGDGAEHIVENIPGISHDAVEVHEGAAKIAFALSLLTGAIAAGALLLRERMDLRSKIMAVVFTAGLFTFIALAYAGWLGGTIRHTEMVLRPLPAIEQNAQ